MAAIDPLTVSQRFLLATRGRVGCSNNATSDTTQLITITHAKERIRNTLYGLLLFGYAARLLQVFSFNPLQHLFSDPLRHWTHASETLHAAPMAYFDPVGYQLWLSVVQKLTAGDPLLVAFYTVALAWLTPWLWYRAFRALAISRPVCLLGWVVLTWLPSWLAIYSYFMTETLFLPLFGGIGTGKTQANNGCVCFGCFVLDANLIDTRYCRANGRRRTVLGLVVAIG